MQNSVLSAPLPCDRRPLYSLRVNTMKVEIGTLEERLRKAGVDVERSPYLPNEYLRVRPQHGPSTVDV